MKKKFLNATFVVATVALTATGSLVAYDRHQQAAFAAANPLFEENLEALADPTGSGYSGCPYCTPGPALDVKHELKTRVTEVKRTQALKDCISQNLLYELDQYSPEQFLTDDVQDSLKIYVVTERKKFFKSKRLEYVPGGTFENCTSQDYTSLSEDGKPQERIYLSEAEYRAEF